MLRSQLAVRKLPVRSMVIGLLVYLAAVYFVAGAFFWFKQGDMLFPAPKAFPKATPADMGLRFEDLRIRVKASDFLHAWWIPAVAPSDKTILGFHGNGYVLEDMVPGEVASLCKLNVRLLLVDYRGYGSSTPIRPSEATVNEDATAALSYLLRDQLLRNERMVKGRSIRPRQVDWQRPGHLPCSKQPSVGRTDSGEPVQQH